MLLLTLILKDFHDLAYTAKNRQDLIKGITMFSNKNLCLVLPIGEYDEDLLDPAMDWIQKLMIKKKTKIIKHTLRQRLSGGGDGIGVYNDAKKHTLIVDDDDDHMIGGAASDKLALSSAKDRKRASSHMVAPKEFDPFRRTGCMFGSLVNEIKHRYAKYVSDITDGLNWHCLLAFVFIFTVCVAPALCFGGIMGKIHDYFKPNNPF